MQPDVVDLRDFYNRPLGGVARRLLTSRIRTRWRNVQGAQVMGLGFAAPYIGMFRGEAERLGALMPAAQGALAWPASDQVQTVMVEEAMPFYKLWVRIEKEFTSGDGYLDKLCMELVGLPSSRCRPPTRDIRPLYRRATYEMMVKKGVPRVMEMVA